MSDERLRALERAAETGGLRERLARDAEILRQRGGVDHPGPPTRFATLALYLGRDVEICRKVRCATCKGSGCLEPVLAVVYASQNNSGSQY